MVRWKGGFKKLEEIAFRDLKETFPDYPKFLVELDKKIEAIERYKRKNFSVSLAIPTIEALKWFADHIKDEEGNSIPVSYVVEDMILWILGDPVIFAAFVSELYSEEEVEEVEEDGEEVDLQEEVEDEG